MDRRTLHCDYDDRRLSFPEAERVLVPWPEVPFSLSFGATSKGAFQSGSRLPGKLRIELRIDSLNPPVHLLQRQDELRDRRTAGCAHLTAFWNTG
jgi:hypothetical protein